MGDRRMGDRREKERGVIKIKFKDAIIYIVLSIILVISVVMNVILAMSNHNKKMMIDQYEKTLYSYENSEEEFQEEFFDDDM